MTERSEHALRYAASGWAVIPIWPVRDGRCQCGTQCGKNAGKHPLSDLVPHGVKDATKDAGTIGRWWARYPDANVAVATGAVSGIFVLDVDLKDNGPEHLVELEELHGPVPETAMVRTANGGSHLYFVHPGTSVRNLVSTLAKGLDVRGDSAYVVAPPSGLSGGREYSWMDRDVPVVNAPVWLVELVTGSGAHYDPLEVSTVLDGVSEGQRDITLFRLACKFRAAGIPAPLVEELLVQAARKCTPPFDEDMAREKVARAFRRYDRDYPATDAGNADRMVDRHGANLKYCEDGRWLTWNGVRWNGDQPNVAVNLAVETTQSIIAQAMETPASTDEDLERRAAAIAHAYASQSALRVMGMVNLARADPALYTPVSDLDADPYLLNVVNGTVDLRNGSIRAHDRSDFITKMAGVPYYPDARAPKWEAFLEKFVPDPEIRSFVHRALGYSVTGSVGEQCLFFCFGSGRNGKSTLVHVIQRLLGQYARTGSPDMLLTNRDDTHPTVLADLIGSRFVPTIETEEGKRMAEAQTKWLTGGDRIKARRMQRDYFEFDPTFKIWLVANHRPVIYGTDLAIWRRIHMVPFVVELPEEDLIRDYGDILVEEEGPGILAWLVRGAQTWLRVGLQPPGAVRAALSDYKDEMNVIGQFLNECVVPEPGAVTPANDVYSSYVGWSKLNGEPKSTQRRFSNKVFEFGYKRERGHANRYYWHGMVLNEVGREYSMIGLGAVEDVASVTFGRRNGA